VQQASVVDSTEHQTLLSTTMTVSHTVTSL